MCRDGGGAKRDPGTFDGRITDVTKRSRNRENALYLVFKLIQRLSRNWYALNGGPMTQAVLANDHFKDGVMQQRPDRAEAGEVVAA